MIKRLLDYATGLWIILITLTLINFVIADVNWISSAIVLAALGMTTLKGLCVIDGFMGLHRVSWRWRGILWAYLLLLQAAIGYTFLQ